MRIYILFNVNEADNSTDLSYELDYMFKGVYKSYVDAFERFLYMKIDLLIMHSEAGLDDENYTDIIKNWKI